MNDTENNSSDEEFNEDELLNEEERDFEIPNSGSQLFRDYNDHISDTDNESDIEFRPQEQEQDSNPQSRNTSPDMFDDSEPLDRQNSRHTYADMSDSDDEFIPPTQ